MACRRLTRLLSATAIRKVPVVKSYPLDRLCASRDCVGDHTGGLASGLRGDAGKHQRQDHAADVSAKDRTTVWKSQSDLGDGSRRSHRGGSARNAGGVQSREVLGGNPTRAADEVGKGISQTALDSGERLRGGETVAAAGRVVHSGPQPGPSPKRARHAAASPQTAMETPARVAAAETVPR